MDFERVLDRDGNPPMDEQDLERRLAMRSRLEKIEWFEESTFKPEGAFGNHIRIVPSVSIPSIPLVTDIKIDIPQGVNKSCWLGEDDESFFMVTYDTPLKK